jgi:hypothetical protein
MSEKIFIWPKPAGNPEQIAQQVREAMDRCRPRFVYRGFPALQHLPGASTAADDSYGRPLRIVTGSGPVAGEVVAEVTLTTPEYSESFKELADGIQQPIRIIWTSDTGWVDKCDSCANDNTCKRLNQCLRYKCEFGKASPP